MLLELQRATHATLQLLTAELVDLDLTPSELNALANLDLGEAGGCTVSALGAAVGTRPTTLTGILDRLERRGLITRAARPGDRRSVLIALTPDGARTAAQITAAMRDLESRALAGLSPTAITNALTVLRALTP